MLQSETGAHRGSQGLRWSSEGPCSACTNTRTLTAVTLVRAGDQSGREDTTQTHRAANWQWVWQPDCQLAARERKLHLIETKNGKRSSIPVKWWDELALKEELAPERVEISSARAPNTWCKHEHEHAPPSPPPCSGRGMTSASYWLSAVTWGGPPTSMYQHQYVIPLV